MNPLQVGASQFQNLPSSSTATGMPTNFGASSSATLPGVSNFSANAMPQTGTQNFNAMPTGQNGQADPMMMMGMMLGMMGMMLMSMMMMVATMLQQNGPMGGMTNPATGSTTGSTPGGTPGASPSPSGTPGASPSPSGTPGAAPAPSAGSAKLQGLALNQFSDLNDPDEGSMCGIVAAEAFARFTGKDLGIAKIKQTAVSNNLWDADNGMHGPATELELLKKSGVNATMDEGAPNWDKVKQEVQAGRPVIISTPAHYLVVEGYDAATGKFDFGNTAKILKASGGKTQYTAEEMMNGALGDRYVPRASIFLA